MSKTLDEYIVYKQAKAFIFNPTFNVFQNLDIPQLQWIKQCIIYYKDDIPDSKKDKILTIVSDLRDINDEKKLERLEIINSIIGEINKSEKDPYNSFYRLQLYDRFNEKIVEVEEENMERVNLLILADFLVLISHIDRISDESFKNTHLKVFTEDVDYYYIIKYIINEYPYILKNEKFVERFKMVHQANIDMGYKYSKGVKKIIKKVINPKTIK